jgi:hypothetical protein
MRIESQCVFKLDPAMCYLQVIDLKDKKIANQQNMNQKKAGIAILT